MAIQDEDNGELEELPMSEDDETLGCKQASIESGRKVYTPEELMSFRGLPCCNIRPDILNEDFFDQSGRWNPNLWHSSFFKRNRSNSRSGGGRVRNLGFHWKHNNYPGRRNIGISGRLLDSDQTLPISGESCGYYNAKCGPHAKICDDRSNLSTVSVSERKSEEIAKNLINTSTPNNDIKQKRNVTFAKSEALKLVTGQNEVSEKENLIAAELPSKSIECSIEESLNNLDNRSEGEPEWLSVSVETNDAEFDFGNLEELKKKYNEELTDVSQKFGCSFVLRDSSKTAVSNFSNGGSIGYTANPQIVTLQDLETECGAVSQPQNTTKDELKAFNSLVSGVKKIDVNLDNTRVDSKGSKTGNQQSRSRISHLFPQEATEVPGSPVSMDRPLPKAWNTDKVMSFERILSAVGSADGALPQAASSWKANLNEGTVGTLDRSFFDTAIPRALVPGHMRASNEESSASWSSMPHVVRRQQDQGRPAPDPLSMYSDPTRMLSRDLQLSSHQLMQQQAEALRYAQRLQQEQIAVTLAQQKLLDIERNSMFLQPRFANAANTMGVNKNLELRILQEQLKIQQDQQRLHNPLNELLLNLSNRNGHLSSQLQAPVRMRQPPPIPGGMMRPPLRLPPGMSPAMQNMFRRKLAGALQHAGN